MFQYLIYKKNLKSFFVRNYLTYHLLQTMQAKMILKNLLFSLPDVLVAHIFEYDTTHRSFFNDPKFELELQRSYLNLKSIREWCIEEVSYYIEDLIEDGNWYNEYGYLASDNGLSHLSHSPKYESIDDFFVSTHLINDTLYYKILPKGATKENCSFLRKPRNFDGYFQHTKLHNNFF